MTQRGGNAPKIKSVVTDTKTNVFKYIVQDNITLSCFEFERLSEPNVSFDMCPEEGKFIILFL